MKQIEIDKFIKKTIRPDIQEKEVYQIPLPGNFVRLDAMESPYGLPDHVKNAIANSIKKISFNRYPNLADSIAVNQLKFSIRENFHIPHEAQIIFGNGSDELINLIIQSCCSPGDVVMSPWPSFVYFEIASKINHAVFVKVPLNQDLQLDLSAMLKAIEEFKPKVIFLAFPNNPTGGLWPRDAVLKILEKSTGLVVLDEAYQPFAKQTWISDVMHINNAIILRTLSKIGLAGLRFGYLIGHAQWLEQIDKVRPPYNMNVLTQTALSTILNYRIALDIQTTEILNARSKLVHALSKITELHVFPSHGNFVLVRFSREINANEIYFLLIKKNILVRNFSSTHPLLDNCFRISVGTHEENSFLISTLEKIIDSKRVLCV